MGRNAWLDGDQQGDASSTGLDEMTPTPTLVDDISIRFASQAAPEKPAEPPADLPRPGYFPQTDRHGHTNWWPNGTILGDDFALPPGSY